MATAKGEAWLKNGIAAALGWDAFVTEGVVKAIAEAGFQMKIQEVVAYCADGKSPEIERDLQNRAGPEKAVRQRVESAGSQKEVDEIVADYMGGDAKVTSLVAQFIDARRRQQQGQPDGGAGAGPTAAASSASGSSAATAQAARSGFARTGGQRLADMRASEEQEVAALEIFDALKIERAGKCGKPKAAAFVEGPDVIDGLKVKRAGKRGKGGGLPKPSRPALERLVANCLACGKVYDCRGTFTADTTAFVESGGACTFCGFLVALNARERSETREMRWSNDGAAADTAAEGAAAKGAPETEAAPAATPAEDREAAAVAFKNRLVQADRTAAHRTVVDDQSDFFEIDGNAWLSEEERIALRARQKAIEEAEEARRKRVTVTVDLLGRQVLMADDSDKEAQPSNAGSGAAAISAASEATAREIPQGGGTSAAAAAATASGLQGSLRIIKNPGLQFQPMFVRSPPKPDGSSSATGGGGGGGGNIRCRSGDASQASRGRSKAALGRQQQQKVAATAPARQQLPRLQHEDPFESAETVALAD